MPSVIALYCRSPNMVRPWLEAGYDAVLVDLQHPEGVVSAPAWNGMLHTIGADMLTWVPPRWLAESDIAFLAAFPPCDHLAVSGARWFAGKGLGKLALSIQLFDRAAFWAEWFGAPYLIENPVSTISSYWRKWDYMFHPWQFSGLEPADTYTKKTCLWTGNGFVMPPADHADDVQPDDRIHKAPPSADRHNFRSETPLGFARAVFAANRIGTRQIRAA